MGGYFTIGILQHLYQNKVERANHSTDLLCVNWTTTVTLWPHEASTTTLLSLQRLKQW